jgi:hypothetical protein
MPSGQDVHAETPESAPQSDQPVRVHDLARELSVTSREVLDRCEPEPAIHHLANALSTVSAEEAQTIREMFNGETQAAATQNSDATAEAVAQTPITSAESPMAPAHQQPFGKRSRRRRGKRGGRGRNGGGGGPASVDHPVATPQNQQHPIQGPDVITPATNEPGISTAPGAEPDKMGRRSRRRRRGRRGGAQPMNQQSNGLTSQPNQTQPSAPVAQAQSNNADSSGAAPQKKKRRALYRAGRVAVSSAARESAGPDE